MSLKDQLILRADNRCELCSSTEDLSVYELPQSPGTGEEACILICNTCSDQIMENTTMDTNHWRCLNDSMWSSVLAVQVMAYRLLHRLKEEGWPQDLLDMMYLDEENLKWAMASFTDSEENEKLTHRDVNGNILLAGDSVVLIKDLKVKGSSMIAKQGTAVRRISLDPDNEKYVEGKVDGQHIVIITKYVKKI
jgi:protein PhnA